MFNMLNQLMASACASGWAEPIKQYTQTPSFVRLNDFLQSCMDTHGGWRGTSGDIYPQQKNVFNAFVLCPPDAVRVIIVGQDPYHEPGEAMGLSFSVPDGTSLPPSLRNIKKEILSDTGKPSCIPHGDLTPWAKQGVFLLNSILTVEKGRALAHANKGWEGLTGLCIHWLHQNNPHPIVYLCWGKVAKQVVEAAICGCTAGGPRLTLTSPHPSPFSARLGFFDSRPFTKINEFLTQHGAYAIEW